VPVRISEIPEEGRDYSLDADERTREAIAATVGVEAIPRLHAAFTLTRRGRDGLHVTGEITALVSQTCVVTLEPMQSDVSEPVDIAFTAAGKRSSSGVAVELSVDAAEPPEPLENGIVDLGRVAVEFLALGIDPYPRKEGAAFELPVSAGEAAEAAAAHPFAALQALKKSP
jgi:uncharacterized metal-binding protein YceD (DUF177 family)